MVKIASSVFTVLFLSFIVFAQDEQSQQQQIVWEKDYKKALVAARESGRPLMIDFTASWCKPCKAMETQFWVRQDVIEAVKPFIAVKIDYDAERGLVNKYNVGAIPFVAFTDPLGNMVTFRRGFGTRSIRELNEIFDEMPKDFSALKKVYEALEQNKTDGTALLQIADAYRASKMRLLSNNFYKRALKTKEIENDAEKKERIVATIGANYYSVNDFAEAENYLEDYLKDYPSGKYREVTITLLAVSCARLNKSKEADKYLDTLRAEFPSSANIAAAVKAIEAARNSPDK